MKFTSRSDDFLPNGQVSGKPLQSNKHNIFIAVMGMTGAGKSTFISHCTDTKVPISAPGSLESCTQEVQVYRCKSLTPHANVYLVDTPGFDDTYRKDADILNEIVTWLTTAYKRQIRLSGILYLHRISDNRMSGCAHRNLAMFKKLCGPEGIKSVVFLTTFWERVKAADGERREKSLKAEDDFWGFFVERGARVQRHWNTEASAVAAIQNFTPSDISEPPKEMKLAIQTEMVDSYKDQERQARELRQKDMEIQEIKINMERMHEKEVQELEKMLLEQENGSRRHLEGANQRICQLECQFEHMGKSQYGRTPPTTTPVVSTRWSWRKWGRVNKPCQG